MWSNEKLEKIFSKSSIRLSIAHGSGDFGSSACCRLCGADANLRYFCETYLCEGVEERYDQILYDSFGIQVIPNDCMICERCVRQLRKMHRFRALVLAAFAKIPSDYSLQNSQVHDLYNSKKIRRGKKSSAIDLFQKIKQSSGIDLLKKAKKSRLDLLKRSKKYSGADLLKKGKKYSGTEIFKGQKCTEIDGIKKGGKSTKCTSKRSLMRSNIPLKRINIACSKCGQRYPMLAASESSKDFTCSRCKKKTASVVKVPKNCNKTIITSTTRERLEMHAISADIKDRLYKCPLPKRPSLISKLEKNLTSAQTSHTLCIPKDTSRNEKYLCGICETEIETRENLEKHMRLHMGQPIYQCDVCGRHFKGKRSFEAHYLTHEK